METDDQQQRAPKREIELDFIRGIAILMVIDYHSSHRLLLLPFAWLGFSPFGWSGVDIFFVLSGFLVGGLLVREWEVHGKVDSRRFLIRRAFKIWPQYYFFLFAILISRHRTLKELWGNLLNVQNYVGGVAHTWSLAVEEHAYLFLLIFFGIATRAKAKISHLLVIVGSICVWVVLWRFLMTNRMNIFYRTDTRIDGIFYGLMLAMLYHTRRDLFGLMQSMYWLWFLIVALALLDFRFVSKDPWWSGPLNILCADLMGVAVLFLLYRHHKSARHSMLYRAVAWIGLYSYGIYLWHVSLIELLVNLSHKLPPVVQMPFEMIVPGIAGVGVGIVMTKLVEFPALKLRDRLFPRRVDSALSVGRPVKAAS